MIEEWRPINGWEGIYSISSLGRVRRDMPGSRTSRGRILTLSVKRPGTLAENARPNPIETNERFTTVTTLKEMETLIGTEVLDYLDREAEVPTVTKAACQGDVGIFRDDTLKPAAKAMPKTVIVVRSEASSNTHSLHPDGPCFWEENVSASVTDLTLGKLTVPEGSRAFLSHPEHGGMSIGPGTYRVGRQREFSGEWQYVAD